jgi:phosphoribosylamine--glycine ligase
VRPRTVCVVGSGAREHALALALGRSADVVVTPGNPGIEATTAEGRRICSTTAPPEALDADLYVIGPEAPLVEGLSDRLRAGGRLVFGPGADGARLEGSKAYMKQMCTGAGIPTASWKAFDEPEGAITFLRSLRPPYVVKTDGLAAGKGVLVTADLAEAETDVRSKLSGTAFEGAGRRVVVEEGMTGPELSVFAVCDGERAVALGSAQDFKRAGDGDTGPNTGGMGAYSPVPVLNGSVDTIMDTIVEPALAALRASGVEYRGVLYAGLMMTGEGPKLVEFNVRFGDPETEVVLPRLAGDLCELLAAAAEGDLRRAIEEARFGTDSAVCVVAAAPGYPESPRTGSPIDGLAEAGTLDGVTVFHAGTSLGPDGSVVTAGGRVLCVSAVGPSISSARARAYEGIGRVGFEGMQFRRDIAERAARGELA